MKRTVGHLSPDGPFVCRGGSAEVLFVAFRKIEFIRKAHHARGIAYAVPKQEELPCLIHACGGDVFLDPDSQLIFKKTVQIASLVPEHGGEIADLKRLHVIVLNVLANFR